MLHVRLEERRAQQPQLTWWVKEQCLSLPGTEPQAIFVFWFYSVKVPWHLAFRSLKWTSEVVGMFSVPQFSYSKLGGSVSDYELLHTSYELNSRLFLVHNAYHFKHVMLRYVMLCYVMLCYVMLCYVMLVS